METYVSSDSLYRGITVFKLSFHSMIIIDCEQNILFNRQKRVFLFQINISQLISKVDLILKLNSWAK